MTRINANISIKELTDQHLLAEHREIKRICYRYSARLKTNKSVIQTGQFRLGKGHETFFLDKGLFTQNRYWQLYAECRRRQFSITNYANGW